MKQLASLLAIGLTWVTTLAAEDRLLTFDHVSPWEYIIIENGYGDLGWNNFFIQNGATSPNGFQLGVISAPNVAFNGLGNPASISSGSRFNLKSAYFTAVYVPFQQIQVSGFSNGVRIYDDVFSANDQGPTLINFNYLGVDRVSFEILTMPGGIFAMDNLVVSEFSDTDGDGVVDELDQCPGTPSGAIVNKDGCTIDQLAPCAGPAGTGWRNHKQYISAVTAAADEFISEGLLTPEEKRDLVKAAIHSDCGKGPRK